MCVVAWAAVEFRCGNCCSIFNGSMVAEKQILDSLLKKLKNGGLAVTFWDGETRAYGTAKPYARVIFNDPKAFRAMLKNVSLGFGESYADGLIDVDGQLDGVARLVFENKATFSTLSKFRPRLHRNTRRNQQGYIAHHYDLGNDFYKLWLDQSLTYSCAYFSSPTQKLEDAQQRKIEHILRKLQLKSGHTLLDIGSGWGTLLITAAKKYGATGLGVTLSKEQLAHSTQAAKKAGVADKVTFELANYQELPIRGLTFDRIVSVGMFEHVGEDNHKDYYRAIDDMLKPSGLSVLHTITQQTEQPSDPWIDKYIFPGGYIPSNREVTHALPNYNFRLLDYENLRLHYAMTLEEWQRRYRAHRKEVITMFDERFYRMWDFWLACSAASFRYGDLDLSQYVFTKGAQNELPLTRESLYTTLML